MNFFCPASPAIARHRCRWLGLLVLAAGLMGCGEAGNPSLTTLAIPPEPGTQPAITAARPKIALVMKTRTNPFFVSMENGARRAERALGIELLVTTASQETSIEQQIQVVDDLIKQGVDALVIAPGDSQRLVPVLKKAADAGIKLVNIDNPLDPPTLVKAGLGNIPLVSVDNEKAAYAAVQFIAQGARPNTQAAILEGIRSAHNAQHRLLGAKRAFAQHKAIQLVASESANWRIDDAYRVTKDMFERHPDIQLLFTANDMMALGALKYLQESQRRTVKVAACDALDEAVAEVRAGRLTVTVDQQAAEQGFQGVALALRLLKGEPVPPVTLIATRLISAAQVQ